MDIPKEPVLFIKTPNTLTAHNAAVKLPDNAGRVDYEAELAIIIKNDIKNISEDEVKTNILGFTCFNDVTARELQKKDGQWTRAKCFDTFAPAGPYFTKDVDPDNLKIKMYLNGEIKQDSTTANFIFSTYYIISYISKIMTLRRGDIVSTGTPPGIGQVKKGDLMEVEIEGIGKLSNMVE